MTDTTTNTGLTRANILTEMGAFGRAFGKGQNSRPSAALRFLEAATKLPDVGPDDASEFYDAFQKAAFQSRGIAYAPENSYKVQISKFKRFGELAMLPGIDGIDLMNRTCDIIKDLAAMAESPLKGSAYDNMVDIARRQIKDATAEMTDDQIRAILSEVPDEKTDLDMVMDAYKKSYRLSEKLADHGVDVTYVDQATDAFAAQIKSMDGDLPPMTKEEQAKAKAFKVLKSQGFTIVKSEPVEEVTPTGNEAPANEEHGELQAAE